MPTGYTSPLYEGKEISFEQFALRCARNFGALVMMRDEPLDAPIPERFEPDEFYRKEYERCKKEYDDFINNPPSEKELEAEYEDRVAKSNSDFQRQQEERRLLGDRYENMVSKVLAWNPPTEEHVSLKEFMLSQLRESMEWDCSVLHPYIPDKKEWISRKLNGKDIKEEMEHYKNLWEKELAATESRNKWIKELRDSLK